MHPEVQILTVDRGILEGPSASLEAGIVGIPCVMMLSKFMHMRLQTSNVSSSCLISSSGSSRSLSRLPCGICVYSSDKKSELDIDSFDVPFMGTKMRHAAFKDDRFLNTFYLSAACSKAPFHTTTQFPLALVQECLCSLHLEH